jgi:sulfhydrogenase subunit beta (sulfur reductase)
MKWNGSKPVTEQQLFLPRQDFNRLIQFLMDKGYRCIGPVLRDAAIQYLPITDAGDLPKGAELQQAPAVYQIDQGQSERLFSWANGPSALRPILFPAHETLWQAQRDQSGVLKFSPGAVDMEPTAVIGVKGCDLAAMQLQDQHFLTPGSEDPQYKKRRDSILLIGVDCSHPSATCFCASTGDGPEVSTGFDLAMSELDDGFILRAGTELGAELLRSLGLSPASDDQIQRSDEQNRSAVATQTRQLPDADLHRLLFERPYHPYWKQIAERCTACGSCTSVCPTCFCFSEHAETSLDASSSQQIREWSSCFIPGHSTFCNHPVRTDIATRYRQWATHKLAGWYEQFGRSGCVGCGRCISWCPVGIDITQAAASVADD